MGASEVIELFLVVGLIIAAAQLMGAAARRLGQPRVFGELLAGVVVGPTVLDLLHWGVFTDGEALYHAVHQLAEIGVLFLMFNLGIELHLRELLVVKKVAVWAGSLGAITPILLTIPAVMLFNYDFDHAIFTGVVMAATSTAIAAQTLLELGLLRTREAAGLLGAVVTDDVLAILALSTVLALLGSSAGNASVLSIAWILVRMLLFIGLGVLISWYLIPPLFNWIAHNPNLASGTAALALGTALIFGWAAEYLGGVAAITGSFIAGLGFSHASAKVKNEVAEAVQRVSYSFLVPIFFVSVGLQSDLKEIGLSALPLIGVLFLAAAASKIIGAGLGGYIGGFDKGESFRLGVSMISRGEVGLILASFGISSGLLTQELFQAVFVVILLTTVLSPPVIRLVFRSKLEEEAARELRAEHA